MDAFTPLVKRLARRVYARRVGSELEFADLIQLGMVGLLEAIDRYTPARGVQFEAFAMRRIQGAILDGLKSYSELQHLLAFRRERRAERLDSLRPDPSHTNLSALDRLVELAIGISMGLLLEASDDEGPHQPAVPENAYERVELKQMQRQLAALVGQLPDVERRVIHRHYFQQQSFEEIARGVALTKGRVSQIHHAALQRLRELSHALRVR